MYRKIAGIFAGIGSLMLIGGGIYCITQGQTETGFALIATGVQPITTMLGFFVGEANGKKLAANP
jgi:hypothetical protein